MSRLVLQVIGLHLALLASTGSGWALILHNDANPVPPDSRPPDAWVARWGPNASAVVIGPDRVVTTRHQGGDVGTTVVVDGVSYLVAQTYNHTLADLRVARLTTLSGGAPNFTSWANVYLTNDEMNQTAVIGGYGKTNAAPLTKNGTVYGYQWSAPDLNAQLRWGQNNVLVTSTINGGYRSEVIVADFDGAGEGGAIAYECAAAWYDSGGGWFIRDGGGYFRLAGLTRGAEAHYQPGHEGDEAYRLQQAWFRNANNPGTLDPDSLDGVRVSVYANWIRNMADGPIPGDANGDDVVDYVDLGILASNYRLSNKNWSGGDFTNDGVVDYLDLGQLASHYRETGLYAPEGGELPEPAALLTLLAGAGLALRRRRRARTPTL